MAANGLFYTAEFDNVSVTNAAQNIWELIAAAGVSVLVHSISVTFSPTITSGVAQDVRGRILLQTITTTGTGGTATTPAPLNARNTIAAATTFNRLVTTPGTLGVVKQGYQFSTVFPWELTFTPDQRVPIAGGGRLALNLPAGLGAAYSASSVITFEEI